MSRGRTGGGGVVVASASRNPKQTKFRGEGPGGLAGWPGKAVSRLRLPRHVRADRCDTTHLRLTRLPLTRLPHLRMCVPEQGVPSTLKHWDGKNRGKTVSACGPLSDPGNRRAASGLTLNPCGLGGHALGLAASWRWHSFQHTAHNPRARVYPAPMRSIGFGFG